MGRGSLPSCSALRLCAGIPSGRLPIREGGQDLLSLLSLLLAFPSWASQLEASPQKGLKMMAVARVPWSLSRAEKLVNVCSVWSSS